MERRRTGYCFPLVTRDQVSMHVPRIDVYNKSTEELMRDSKVVALAGPTNIVLYTYYYIYNILYIYYVIMYNYFKIKYNISHEYMSNNNSNIYELQCSCV